MRGSWYKSKHLFYAWRCLWPTIKNNLIRKWEYVLLTGMIHFKFYSDSLKLIHLIQYLLAWQTHNFYLKFFVYLMIWCSFITCIRHTLICILSNNWSIGYTHFSEDTTQMTPWHFTNHRVMFQHTPKSCLFVYVMHVVHFIKFL